MTDSMMTIAEASKKYKLSKSLLYELCRLGKLTYYRIGVRGKGKILIGERDMIIMFCTCRITDPCGDDDEPLKHIR